MNLSRRGVWFKAAIGQILRHSPGATKNKIGRLGTKNFQKIVKPTSGTTNKSSAVSRAQLTLMIRKVCQTHIGIRGVTCIKLGKRGPLGLALVVVRVIKGRLVLAVIGGATGLGVGGFITG